MYIYRSRTPKLLAVLVFILVSACTAPTKTDVKSGTLHEKLQGSNESIVLFPTYQKHSEAHEKDFIRCLKQELEIEVSRRFKIVDTAAFQDALFPWFEAQYAPSNIQELNSLISRPLVRERISSLGIRYLVNIARSTTSGGFPGMFCGGGFGAAGCLGLSWEDEYHEVDAVIFDLVEGDKAGDVSVRTSGRSLGFAFVIPVVFIAHTKRDACKALATELSKLFTLDPNVVSH